MSTVIGKPAPDFKAQALMPDKSFGEVSLSDLSGKWVVLFFYPLDFTFVCPTEINGFNEKYAEFQRENAEVVGASIDSVFSHLAWTDNGLGQLQFPLVSDITKKISADYGVLDEQQGIAVRGTFIIDPEGNLRSMVVNDTATGRSIDETLRTLRALKTGELTPCGWEPGKKTLGKA